MVTGAKLKAGTHPASVGAGEVTVTPNKSLARRLNAVREKVKYIAKDLTVTNYMAVSHDAVTAAVRKHLIDEGVLIIPSVQRSAMVETGAQTNKGVPIRMYEACYEVRFVNIDDTADNFSMLVDAHALDSGDKAPGKALSYAVKYALLKVLNIETGENEESREELIALRITEDQLAELVAICESAELDVDKTLARLAQIYKTSNGDIKTLDRHKFDTVKQFLQEHVENYVQKK